MPEALAVVKVGNSACGLAKLTPLSRTAAIAGAVPGLTDDIRNPSGTNRIKLCGAALCDWLCAGFCAWPCDIAATTAQTKAAAKAAIRLVRCICPPSGLGPQRIAERHPVCAGHAAAPGAGRCRIASMCV